MHGWMCMSSREGGSPRTIRFFSVCPKPNIWSSPRCARGKR